MSKNRKKPKTNASRKKGPRLSVIALASLALIAVMLVVWQWPRILRAWQASPALPKVDTTALEPAAATLIEQHLRGVRETPRSADAWGMLGGVLRSFRFRNEAEVCLTEAMRLNPKDPRWPYLLGTLLALESTPQAIPHLRRAVQLCGNEPEAPRLHLARLLLEMGQTQSARAELEPLLRAKPGFSPGQLTLARINQAETNWTAALALARPCTTNVYTSRAAWTLLGTLYQRTGDTNAAQLAERRAQSAAPDVSWPDPFEAEFRSLRTDAQSLSDQAEELLLAGRPNEAEPFIHALTNNHPSFAEAWLLIGRMQLLQQNPVAAEASLRRFLAVNADSVNGNFQLGMSLMRQNRFEEAAAVFRATTALKKDFGPAFFNLGFALARSGKKEEAIQPFREAIRHNPERIDSYILLADLYLQLGRQGEAIDMAAQAERLNPLDPRVGALRKKILF